MSYDATENFYLSSENVAGYHPEPVVPSAADPAYLDDMERRDLSSH